MLQKFQTSPFSYLKNLISPMWYERQVFVVCWVIRNFRESKPWNRYQTAYLLFLYLGAIIVPSSVVVFLVGVGLQPFFPSKGNRKQNGGDLFNVGHIERENQLTTRGLGPGT